MKLGILLLVMGLVVLGLGIYLYPKVKQQPPPVRTPQPAAVQAPAPPPPVVEKKQEKASVTLDRSKKYESKEEFEWIIFLPPGSGWINVGQRLIGERGTAVYYPRKNSLVFETEDWIDTYRVRAGSSGLAKPDSKSFYLSAAEGDCLPVFIKNVSERDLTVRLTVSNYPYQYDPPVCQ